MCISERKAFPGRGKGRCRGPELGTSRVSGRTRRTLTGDKWVRRRVEGDEISTEGTGLAARSVSQFWINYTWANQGQRGLGPRPPNPTHFAVSASQGTRGSRTQTFRALRGISVLHWQTVWQPLRLQAKVLQFEHLRMWQLSLSQAIAKACTSEHPAEGQEHTLGLARELCSNRSSATYQLSHFGSGI